MSEENLFEDKLSEDMLLGDKLSEDPPVSNETFPLPDMDEWILLQRRTDTKATFPHFNKGI